MPIRRIYPNALLTISNYVYFSLQSLCGSKFLRNSLLNLLFSTQLGRYFIFDCCNYQWFLYDKCIWFFCLKFVIILVWNNFSAFQCFERCCTNIIKIPVAHLFGSFYQIFLNQFLTH